MALPLLQGVERVRDILLANTLQFAGGFPANNALIWGSRGMGKSSLVKAIHAEIIASQPPGSRRLILVEIQRDDIPSLPLLLTQLRSADHRFILFDRRRSQLRS